jgi:polyisoprenoid-binding protein YceI
MTYSIRLKLSLIFVSYFCLNNSVGFSATPTTNPAAFKYASTSGGQAAVSGTSTLHNWTVTGSVIQGSAEFSGEWKPGATQPVTLQSIDLAISVDSLKSTEGSGMDNTMYDAMKLKQFPTISYKLTKANSKPVPAKDASPYLYETTGDLTIAGFTHPVNLNLSVQPHDDGQLTISTDIALKMSDFGITPPTAMLGMIKSGDAITVKVSWQLSDPSPTATAAK